MATTVNVRHAKAHLSALLRRVEAGEEIVIARAGAPVAKLVAVAGVQRRRNLGFAEGRVVIHPEFYDPLPDDLLDLFEGRAPSRPREVRLGTARGRIELLPGWDDPMTDEELEDWYGPAGRSTAPEP